jgi:hypothetical protein
MLSATADWLFVSRRLAVIIALDMTSYKAPDWT